MAHATAQDIIDQLEPESFQYVCPWLIVKEFSSIIAIPSSEFPPKPDYPRNDIDIARSNGLPEATVLVPWPIEPQLVIQLRRLDSIYKQLMDLAKY